MTNFYIGWDVGTWSCTSGTKKSCDALVVMNEQTILGHCRRNLSKTIRNNTEVRPQELISNWFQHCSVTANYSENDHYYIAMDTPLGWPRGFVSMLAGNLPTSWTYCPKEYDIQNPLLFRRTERQLNSGFSVVTHSIGNQSTKGMLLICGLKAEHGQWGVWTKGNLTLIETYPKACLRSETFVNWMASQPNEYDIREWYHPVDKTTRRREKSLKIQDDTFDAAVCAFLAKAFATKNVDLVQPLDVPKEGEKAEGWIFYPDGNLIQESLADKHSSVTNSWEVSSFSEAVKAFQSHVQNNRNQKDGPSAAESLKSNHGHAP